MDFRSDSVEATVRALGSSGGAGFGELGESGCVAVRGGRRVQVMLELPTLFISMVCLFAVPALLICGFSKVLPSYVVTPLLLLNLGVLLVLRRFKSWLLSVCLGSRPESLLKAYSGLPREYVGLENGDTYKNALLMCYPDDVF